jgi:hypothetical protein
MIFMDGPADAGQSAIGVWQRLYAKYGRSIQKKAARYKKEQRWQARLVRPTKELLSSQAHLSKRRFFQLDTELFIGDTVFPVVRLDKNPAPWSSIEKEVSRRYAADYVWVTGECR